MPQSAHQYAENVIQVLAQHLGVPEREILLGHDLQCDWGITPLSLVVILLDLERLAAVELPSEELCGVRTVSDLVIKFRAWVHDSDARNGEVVHLRARRSRASQSERRLRRELHHLRWLEQNAQRKSSSSLRALRSGDAARRVLNQ